MYSRISNNRPGELEKFRDLSLYRGLLIFAVELGKIPGSSLCIGLRRTWKNSEVLLYGEHVGEAPNEARCESSYIMLRDLKKKII